VRLVELELRILLAIQPKAPIVEQKGTESCPFDPLEELLGDDLIGVYVAPRESCDPAMMGDKWFHEAPNYLCMRRA
jgi:hypothetical protein